MIDGNESVFGRVKEFVHRHFLWLLIVAYVLAALWSGPGESLRRLAVGSSDTGVAISLPMLLLAVLLFNAGIGANVSELTAVLRRPRALVVGVVANALVPIGFLLLLAQGLRSWPDPDEAQCLLVGLAVVAAMPVAGSSTAWAQNANGSAALSLGLVVLSTLLSPVTTPLTLAAVEPLTQGDYAVAIGELGGRGTGTFLLACVVFPSLAGMACRCFGVAWINRIKPTIKFINSIVLLALCYTNASSVLPKIAAEPDWDFLALCLSAVVGLCLAAFAAGWVLARLLQSSESQTRSLVFALGMNNNGTGIVLACSALAGLPGAVLPVLAYNLVQHLVAGGVNRQLGKGIDG
ncbi:MAG TPA: bile acid:sodium symporter [Gemmata sp.]|jgi:BASS family bile acid:Na+ symporter|nr:bile acid:sodium symporter [Gemmata sp.]